MKRLHKQLFFLSLFVFSFLAAHGLQAAPQDQDYGLTQTANTAGLVTGGDDKTLAQIVGNVIGSLLSLVGVIFFALMVYGGFIWMTARGNEEDTKKALATIKAAVIGMIVVLASFGITTFVFRSVEGTAVSPTPAGGGAGAPQVPNPSGCVDLQCATVNNVNQNPNVTPAQAAVNCSVAGDLCTYDPALGCIYIEQCGTYDEEGTCEGTIINGPPAATPGYCSWEGN